LNTDAEKEFEVHSEFFMGLESNAVRFLISARQAGVNFDSTLTLGHQWLLLTRKEAKRLCAQISQDPDEILRKDGYADNFLKALGAVELRTMDFSSYEGADIVHDLNQPIPGAEKLRFDVVIDGGTLEHVFNFPQALKNAMELVKVGGRLFCIAPTNNHCGHGFYQLSPELYYRAFCAANGYAVERMYAHEWNRNVWYAVSDPDAVGRRVEITRGRRSTLLMVQAKRTAERAIFETPPLQSDYVAAWRSEQDAQQSRFVRFLHRTFPHQILNLLRGCANFARDPLCRQRTLKDLRYFNRNPPEN
jgi:SAM-dependent methyltransferase